MVEEDGPVQRHQWVVETDLDNSGPETDVIGPFRGRSDEDVRSGHVFPTCAVVLSNPGLVVAETVELDNQVQISFQGFGWILGRMVEWLKEESESHVVNGSGHIDARQYIVRR
jgi:hypothetical protein